MTVRKCFWQNWFWAVLILALICLAQMFWPGGKWREIEQNVKESISIGLLESGIDWAEVHTHDRGRDVMLSGSAPSEEEKQKALKIASDLILDERGNTVARVVQWEGEIKPPVIPLTDGNIQMSVVSGKASLAGVVASEEEKIQLISAASAFYGAKNVDDQLVVGQHIKPRDNFVDLVSGYGLSDGILRLLDGQLTITGTVDSEDAKSTIGSNLLGVIGGDYKLLNKIKVVLPPPPPDPEPDPRVVCQAKVLEIMSTSKVYFETGKAQIKDDSYALLTNISAVLSECPDSMIEVAGHTDATGSESFNLPLSQSRAEAVVEYLLAQGIPAERLSSEGFGSERPIADNETDEGRAANRRIEFIVK